MAIWYLDNCDEPESFEGDATLSPTDSTSCASLNIMFESIVRQGVTIEGKIWIPPHRILKIDL